MSKFDSKRCQKIIDYVKDGNYIEVACEASGISKVTLYKWLKDAELENADIHKINFANSLKEAKALAETVSVERIRGAAKESWQAAAWYLERTAYKRWGRKDYVVHDIGDGFITINYNSKKKKDEEGDVKVKNDAND